MSVPSINGIDHIHLAVPQREEAVDWYERVLGFTPVKKFSSWAEGGPLTLTDTDETVHLALFEREAKSGFTSVAFSVDAAQFLAWRDHLSGNLAIPIRITDHALCYSLYFSDPWGNPFELTSYDYTQLSNAFSEEA